jgi:hypothetical protein
MLLLLYFLLLFIGGISDATPASSASGNARFMKLCKSVFFALTKKYNNFAKEYNARGPFHL